MTPKEPVGSTGLKVRVEVAQRSLLEIYCPSVISVSHSARSSTWVLARVLRFGSLSGSSAQVFRLVPPPKTSYQVFHPVLSPESSIRVLHLGPPLGPPLGSSTQVLYSVSPLWSPTRVLHSGPPLWSSTWVLHSGSPLGSSSWILHLGPPLESSPQVLYTKSTKRKEGNGFCNIQQSAGRTSV